jgi:hypothetical protein
MSSRAEFNRLCQIGKLTPADMPSVIQEGDKWISTKDFKQHKFEAINSKKIIAVDEVLDKYLAAFKRTFCCDKLCFPRPSSQVDGLACNKCRSYGYCLCNCLTHVPRKTTYEQLWTLDGEYTVTFRNKGEICQVSVVIPSDNLLKTKQTIFKPISLYDNEKRIKELIKDSIKTL